MEDTMTAPYWLGIDIGTQSIKSVILDNEGVLLASASAPLSSTRINGQHEQDPEQWWSAATRVIQDSVSQISNPSKIKGLSIAATSGSILLVDESCNPISAGIMYDDARGAEFTAECNLIGRKLWDDLGVVIQPSWALTKMVWLSRNNKITAGSKIIHQGDFVASRLAKTFLKSDTSNTLKSGYDFENLNWPEDVMNNLGIPTTALPQVAVAGEVIGYVADDNSIGLPGGIAIIAGMTDGCAAQISAAAITPGSWNSVLGTTLVIKGVSNNRCSDFSGAIYSHRAPFSDGWWPGGASSTGTNALNKWLTDQDPTTLSFNWPELLAAPVIYPLPGEGERFPFVNSDMRELVLNDGEFPSIKEHGEDAVFASIAKGIAFIERLSYDLIALVGYDVSGSITFTGGGAKNGQWNQLRSTVLNRDVFVPDSPEGAAGMAILAAASFDTGSEKVNKLAQTMIRFKPSGKTIMPQPDLTRPLLDQYLEFLEMLSKNALISKDLYLFAADRAIK